MKIAALDLAADVPPNLDGLGAARLIASNDRIVLTGASGWLGLATLELLYNTLGTKAFDRRVRCFGSSERTLSLRDGTGIVQKPLSGLADLNAVPTLLLHHAFLTKDRAEAMDDAAYVAANIGLRQQVLDALDGIGVVSIFLPSSGAARFATDPGVSAAMRIYGRLKLEDEQIFAAWAEERGNRAAIVRVFNVAGPYINKHAAYALAGFILDALAGRPLEVRATRPVLRSYVAIRELMSIVFGLLTDSELGVVHFDTAGDIPMEMEVVAREVAAVIADVPVRRAVLSAQAADDYVGDPVAYTRYRDALHVRAVPFRDQIAETAADLVRSLAPE